jgi:hypothetical protein
MKIMKALLMGVMVFLIASGVNAFGVTPKYYGMNLSASLSTQSVSGSTYSFTTRHINNNTIINTLFDSGTTGALKASDLALAFGETGISVINTSATNQVIAVLAKSGTNSSQPGEIATTTKTNATLTIAESGFEFTLPGVPDVQTADVLVWCNRSSSDKSFLRGGRSDTLRKCAQDGPRKLWN